MTAPSDGVSTSVTRDSVTTRDEPVTTRPRGRMVPAYTPSLPGIVQPIDPSVNELPPDNRTLSDGVPVTRYPWLFVQENERKG
jgi:hypothetical protein